MDTPREISPARQRKRLQTVISVLVLLAAVITAIGGWFVATGRLDVSAQLSRLLATEAEGTFNAGYDDNATRLATAEHQKIDLLSRASSLAEWVLARAAHWSRLDAPLGGHTDRVTSAQFSPDGTRIRPTGAGLGWLSGGMRSRSALPGFRRMGHAL